MTVKDLKERIAEQLIGGAGDDTKVIIQTDLNMYCPMGEVSVLSDEKGISIVLVPGHVARIEKERSELSLVFSEAGRNLEKAKKAYEVAKKNIELDQ